MPPAKVYCFQPLVAHFLLKELPEIITCDGGPAYEQHEAYGEPPEYHMREKFSEHFDLLVKDR